MHSLTGRTMGANRHEPKISVPVGVVTVDDEGVTVRQQQRS